MTAKQTYTVHAQVFAALGNPLRHELFHHVAEEPATVAELARRAGVSPSNVSQHLAVLARHGLVMRRRVGGRVAWAASDPRWTEVCHVVDTVLGEQLTETLAALTGDE